MTALRAVWGAVVAVWRHVAAQLEVPAVPLPTDPVPEVPVSDA